MLIRAIALSLALIIGVGTIIPLATEYAEAGPKKSKRYKKKPRKKYKKYSKRWWRQYHARMKRKRALQARRRAMRLRRLRLAKLRRAKNRPARAKQASTKPVVSSSQTAVLPSGQAAPKGWKPGSSTSGELQFRIDNGSGVEIGSASISVVGPAMMMPSCWYPRTNLWIPSPPSTMPQIPAAIFLSAPGSFCAPPTGCMGG